MTLGFNPLDAFSLKGQTAVVTGGANGIGRAVATGRHMWLPHPTGLGSSHRYGGDRCRSPQTEYHDPACSWG